MPKGRPQGRGKREKTGVQTVQPTDDVCQPSKPSSWGFALANLIITFTLTFIDRRKVNPLGEGYFIPGTEGRHGMKTNWSLPENKLETALYLGPRIAFSPSIDPAPVWNIGTPVVHGYQRLFLYAPLRETLAFYVHKVDYYSQTLTTTICSLMTR
ncbi:unnamed protein product, partial [Nesidiocoris tenuis]